MPLDLFRNAQPRRCTVCRTELPPRFVGPYCSSVCETKGILRAERIECEYMRIRCRGCTKPFLHKKPVVVGGAITPKNGPPFTPLYCSDACFNRLETNCRCCRKPVAYSRQAAVAPLYCSDACFRSLTELETPCRCCRKPVVYSRGANLTPLYCSDACFDREVAEIAERRRAAYVVWWEPLLDELERAYVESQLVHSAAATCTVCQMVFFVAKGAETRAKFCSYRCRATAYGVKPRIKRVPVQCARCDTTFMARPSDLRRSHDKYCSKECQYPNGVATTCLHCNGIFRTTQKKLERGNGKFCSMACLRARQDALRPPPKPPRPPSQTILRPCLHCEKPVRVFASRQKRQNMQFCSFDCRQKHTGRREVTCDHCGKAFTRIQSHIKRGQPTYCSNSCRGYAVGQRRRATKLECVSA